MNREYLQSLHAEAKKNQAKKLIQAIIDKIKTVAETGRTSYYHDITRHSFGTTNNIYRGTIQASLLPLADFIELLKEELKDCSITIEGEEEGNLKIYDTFDASGNLVDDTPRTPTDVPKRHIHVSWE